MVDGRQGLRYVELALLGTGLTLLFLYAVTRFDAQAGREEAIANFDAAEEIAAVGGEASDSGVPVKELSQVPSDALEPNQALWAENRIVAYRQSLNVGTGALEGVLSIPAVELEVPIFEGTSELALNRGAGRIEGTAAIGGPGNVGIAGHRDGFFRVLKDVQLNDEIIVRSVGETTRYRIAELLIVSPKDVWVLDPTDEATLTLVTCYPFYFVGSAPQRYIVKAVKMESG
jgi:sortase A